MPHATIGPATPSPSATSTSLLRRVQTGEPQSWESFVRLYAPLILHWARQAGAPQADAGDVVQDVFGAVAANIGNFNAQQVGGSLRGWLRTITRNKTFDLLRRQRGQPQAPGGTEAFQQMQELPAESETTSQQDLQYESRLLVHRALKLLEAEFPERSMRAFLQLVVEDRKAPEVATALEMSVASVYMTKYRILKRLREVLDDSTDNRCEA